MFPQILQTFVDYFHIVETKYAPKLRERIRQIEARKRLMLFNPIKSIERQNNSPSRLCSNDNFSSFIKSRAINSASNSPRERTAVLLSPKQRFYEIHRRASSSRFSALSIVALSQSPNKNNCFVTQGNSRSHTSSSHRRVLVTTPCRIHHDKVFPQFITRKVSLVKMSVLKQ